jgi:acyl carrier protein
VELGEVEKQVCQHPLIAEAMIIERGEQENKELIAYIIPQSPVTSNELAEYLLQYLPDYMVPAYFVEVKSFPLTSNGKLDKSKLPAPAAVQKKYTAPVTPEEKILVEIWEETLGRQGVGTEDNFFELGGHSLKATRIISGVYKRLKKKVTLKNIFLYPTIKSFASFIGSAEEVLFYHIPRLPQQADYELSHSQKRIWILDQLEEDSLAFVLPMAINVRGQLNTAALMDAFKKMTDRHESLRTVFVNRDGTPRQVIKAPGELPFLFEVLDFSGKEQVDELMEAQLKKDTLIPFSLENGPLLRGKVIIAGGERYVFSFAIHHIISDGWSMEIFVKELMAFYNAFINHTDAALLPLQIQYKDFCGWQNNQLADSHIEKSRIYWLSRQCSKRR